MPLGQVAKRWLQLPGTIAVGSGIKTRQNSRTFFKNGVGGWVVTKRLWFTTQRPLRYMPLKAGLGIITAEQLREYGVFYGSEVKAELLKFHQLTCKSLTDIDYHPEMLCPKLYTTRSHRLNGDYQVVEGSRYKKDDVHPVEPEIILTAVCRGQLDLRNRTIDDSPLLFPDSFAQADLGIKNATFDDLISVILKLNKNNTIDTKFYVNRLFPVDKVSDEQEQSVIKTGTEGITMQEKTHNTDVFLRRKAVEQSQLTNWGLV